MSVEELVSISAQVPASLRDQLQAVAAEHDRSLSAELRRAIRDYVEATSQEGAA